jgi:flagellar biosynthesis/type III secretory pathway chaperone
MNNTLTRTSHERRRHMASLIETLIEVLEAETGCYQKLLDMADNKKDVIINGDVPSLQEITKDEQELAGHILRLEKTRQENLKDICTVTNKKEIDMTIEGIMGILKGKEKDKLRAVSSELENILELFKTKNETNRLLIEQSLEYVDYTMNAVQGMRSMPASNNYENKGNLYKGYKGKNFFDAKQ